MGDSDHADPEWADPDHYRERATDEELTRMIPKFEHRFPGLGGARLSSSYAGCYDVTPDYNPMISASSVDGVWLCAGFSGHGYKISPSVGELMADLITTGTQPASRHRPPTTSGGSASPSTTTWSAPIPTPVQGRCAESSVPRSSR